MRNLKTLDAAPLLGGEQPPCDQPIESGLGLGHAGGRKFGAGIFAGHRIAMTADGDHAVLDILAHRFALGGGKGGEALIIEALENVGALRVD